MLTYRGKPIPSWFVWLTLLMQVAGAVILALID
jgi:hypothetical protein